MLELVAEIILIVSILNMGVIVLWKIPVLRNLPVLEGKITERKKIPLSLVFRKKIKNFWLSLNKRIFLDLKNFKKYSKEEDKFSDDYWNNIRKG